MTLGPYSANLISRASIPAVNTTYSTRTRPLKLTQIQIRIKAINMLQTWNKAQAIVTKLNNCHLSSSDVQYKVTECCHYYNLEKVWTHLGPSTDCTSSRSLPSQPNSGTGVFSEDEIEGHGIETADSAPTSAISKARELHRNPWPGNEDPYHFKPCDSNKVEQNLRSRRQELEREQQELDRQNLEMREIQVEKHTSNMLAEIDA